MKLKDLTPGNIRNFLQGMKNYYTTSPKHVREQALYRANLCQDCLANGSCVVCGCKTPHMFFSPNKKDSKGKWSTMLSSYEWEQFKSQNNIIIFDDELLTCLKKIN